jgi:hypothetical protein
MTELAAPTHEQPLATAIFESTLKDDEIKEALTLYQDTENRRADVYNIIEFLDGPNQIEQSGFGARKAARVATQTANHYRHLGRQSPLCCNLTRPHLAKHLSSLSEPLGAG